MAASKGKKGSKKMSKSKKGDIDVKSAKDLPKFLDLFNDEKGSTTVVLLFISMEGCPHCDTLNDDVWSKLKSVPNKKVTMAKMAHDQVANVPALANVPLEGYPSVLLLGKDMKPAKFKDNNGNSTYSIPEARNLSTMNNIVTEEPTESNLSTIPNMVSPPNVGTFETKPYENESSSDSDAENSNMNTLTLNKDAEANRTKDSAKVNEIIGKTRSGTSSKMNTMAPPNPENDVIRLNSQEPNVSSSMEFTGNNKRKTDNPVGGSLYRDLITNSVNKVVGAVMPGGSRKVGRRKGRKTRRN